MPATACRIPTLALLLLVAAACSDGSGGQAGGGPGAPSAPGPECEGEAFASTFEGIQRVVFEKRGCTQEVCHGSAAQGGLELSPDVAYRNLFDVPAVLSTLKRIEPGDKDRSFLWLKLAAATQPGSVAITGAPMPNGLPPISAQELEAIRLWIYAGAPETGTVTGTETLLDARLPRLPHPQTTPCEEAALAAALPDQMLGAIA